MKINKVTQFVTLLFGTAGVSGAAMAQSVCDLKTIRTMAPKGAVVDTVTAIASPIAHCEVVGHTITQDPGPNRVEWTVMLPDEGFKNRYYFIGQGAAAGVVPTTRAMEGDFEAIYADTFSGTDVQKQTQKMMMAQIAGSYAATAIRKMAEGFAVAGTDTGHKGFMWDFMIDNPAAKYDHGHRGAHVSAVATQAITRAYYDMKDKLYRYHLGCSGGGRMGAMAALHHPEDYDGIVASTGFGKGSSMWFPWIIQYLVENPDRWISPPKLAFLERKVAEHCAGPDGLVRDQNVCGFDLATVQCPGESTDTCLTKDEIDMAKRITSPHPVGPGEESGGFTLSNPVGWSDFLIGRTPPTSDDLENPWAPEVSPSSFWIAQSILRGVYFNDANFNMLTGLDFDNPEHLQILEDHHADWGATSPDLSAFKKAGGKYIQWAPLGENAVPPATETQYHDELAKTVPDIDAFFRTYEVPGVWHCAGGPGPQDSAERFLDKVIAWVEQGEKPEGIVVNGVATQGVPQAAPSPTRTVLVCPYPGKAVFAAKEGAFPYDAANWKCE
ncbi:MAG: tannase/feruloyl esterase family alpha/beta hydrolase [Bacteroidales bacterium]|nr:tannase/feruloyl esterase family alpha/beta hydrolase [Bacteroidales bacterium]